MKKNSLAVILLLSLFIVLPLVVFAISRRTNLEPRAFVPSTGPLPPTSIVATPSATNMIYWKSNLAYYAMTDLVITAGSQTFHPTLNTLYTISSVTRDIPNNTFTFTTTWTENGQNVSLTSKATLTPTTVNATSFTFSSANGITQFTVPTSTITRRRAGADPETRGYTIGNLNLTADNGATGSLNITGLIIGVDYLLRYVNPNQTVTTQPTGAVTYGSFGTPTPTAKPTINSNYTLPPPIQ